MAVLSLTARRGRAAAPAIGVAAGLSLLGALVGLGLPGAHESPGSSPNSRGWDRPPPHRWWIVPASAAGC